MMLFKLMEAMSLKSKHVMKFGMKFVCKLVFIRDM